MPSGWQVFGCSPVVEPNHLVRVKTRGLNPAVAQKVASAEGVAVISLKVDLAEPLLQVWLKPLVCIDRQYPIIGCQFGGANSLRAVSGIGLLMDYRSK